MTRKWPDTRVGTELYEFNREFLELIRETALHPEAFGLESPLRRRLAGLTPSQLDAIARTPCLLASFSALPPRLVMHGVSESRPVETRVPAVQADAARLFSASLLAWLWHAARRDRLLAALCIGPELHALEGLRGAGFRDLQRTAATATECLEARFCRHARLWPDLIRAASLADPTLMAATRLSVVQLTLVQRTPVTQSPGAPSRRWQARR